jgi:hypothetical protein
LYFPRVARSPNAWLVAAAVLNAVVALLHVGCVIFGASWYRFFGAGEHMASMAAAGRWYPTVLTLGIAAGFTVCALYALSGADLIRRLPLLRIALCLITAGYLLRGIAWVALVPRFPDNGPAFWFWSSSISVAIGLVHVVGAKQTWSRL